MNDFRKKFNVIAFLAEQNYIAFLAEQNYGGDSPRDYTVERFAEDVLLKEIERLNEDLRFMSLLSEKNSKEADGLGRRVKELVKELEEQKKLYNSLQEETKGFYDWGSDRRDEVIVLRVESGAEKTKISELLNENEALQKAKDTWHQVAVENAKETEQVRTRVKELEVQNETFKEKLATWWEGKDIDRLNKEMDNSKKWVTRLVLEKDLLHKENEALRAENVKLEQQNKYRKPGVHRLPSNYYEDEEEG